MEKEGTLRRGWSRWSVEPEAGLHVCPVSVLVGRVRSERNSELARWATRGTSRVVRSGSVGLQMQVLKRKEAHGKASEQCDWVVAPNSLGGRR